MLTEKNCTKCRKAIDGQVSQKSTGKECHKCNKESSTYRCSKKPTKAFEVQASSKSIKQHASKGLIKCTTALKKELGSKDKPDDYILLDGPVYIRKNCLDENGGTCRGTCCSSGEIGEVEIEVDEPVSKELTEEQRYEECRECCNRSKCAEAKICDDSLDIIVATYEKMYLRNQTESGLEKDSYDYSGKQVTGLAKTHGETPGDGKYHFLMKDVACSAPSDDQNDTDVIMTVRDAPSSSKRPVSAAKQPVFVFSDISGNTMTTNYAPDTSADGVQMQSQTLATSDDDRSDVSVLMGKLEPDEEEAHGEGQAQGEVKSEEKADSLESESEKNDEGERRDSKVSWGEGESHRTTVDTTLSDEERDRVSHVRISEAPKQDSDTTWKQPSMDRTRNSKKGASFVKKSLVSAPSEHEQQPPPAPPPPKKKFCSFFRRKKKDKVTRTSKSRSQTFNKEPDSSESSDISFEESRRNSSRSKGSE